MKLFSKLAYASMLVALSTSAVQAVRITQVTLQLPETHSSCQNWLALYIPYKF
jgi:hypothetical protein